MSALVGNCLSLSGQLRAGSCCSLRIYQIVISSQEYKSATCNKLRLTWPIGVWLVLLKPKLQLKVFFFTLQITLQSQTTKVGPGCRLKPIQIHKYTNKNTSTQIDRPPKFSRVAGSSPPGELARAALHSGARRRRPQLQKAPKYFQGGTNLLGAIIGNNICERYLVRIFEGSMEEH